MKVTYKGHMHDDLFVANAARVSFHKESEQFSDGDERLINFLAREGHFLPFRHPHISLHIKAPIFVFRQLDKHQVGFSTSEISRRYVDETPELFEPEVWRKRVVDKKQGSSDTETVEINVLSAWYPEERANDQLAYNDYSLGELYYEHQERSILLYEALLKADVAPEQARMILPQSMYTEQIKTGSLLGWSHLYKLRSDGHAQKESQEMARQIKEIIEPLFPVSWRALTS